MVALAEVGLSTVELVAVEMDVAGRCLDCTDKVRTVVRATAAPAAAVVLALTAPVADDAVGLA